MELSSTNTNMHENKMLIASRIFAEYGNFIRVIILSQVGNENLADDIFQDFFLSLVYKPIPHNVKNIKSYLYKAITHDIVDAARRVERYKSRMYKYSGQFNYFINNTRPENALIEKEQIDKILKLLKKQLSKSEAQAVSLRYKNDYSIKEVAERMDVDSRTISRYISIGLKKIRQCLMINEVLK